MKTLAELGISPAPWKVCDERTLSGDIVGVECADKRKDLVAGDIVITEQNAKLIAAAPDLYNSLQSLVEYIDRECVPCGENACKLMVSAHNALAKAAGEALEKAGG